jgi:hypothetical protein
LVGKGTSDGGSAGVDFSDCAFYPTILGIAAYYLLPDGVAQQIEPLDPVFWFEAIAVVFFGISWLIKGEAILGDREADEEA